MSQSESAVLGDDNRIARRNAFVLAVAGALGGGIGSINIIVAGLTGAYLLGPDKSLATLPVSAFTIGMALSTIPAALLMRRVGRRTGFQVGSLLAMLGGVLGGMAVLGGTFTGFVLAMLVAGCSMAFVQQYRFAAADMGSPAFRAKAISFVFLGGVAAAVIGPQTVILTRDLLTPVPFAGAFFGMSGLAALAVIVLSFLSGQAGPQVPDQALPDARPLAEIVLQPTFITALVCGIGAYSLMSLLMTAAPLAMIAHDHSQNDAALGIQWHALAMFAPSFVTGSLIVRFGARIIIGIGFALLALCAVIALAGVDLMNFWLSLILLGLGWNFGFIGATTMLTTTYRPEEKAKVQGLNDFLVFSSVALASLLSGRLFATLGWAWINVVAFPIIAVCLIALAAMAFLRRRNAM
ncbi:MAG: MFS transporter [Alphaproteobacteria bacterium]